MHLEYIHRMKIGWANKAKCFISNAFMKCIVCRVFFLFFQNGGEMYRDFEKKKNKQIDSI